MSRLLQTTAFLTGIWLVQGVALAHIPVEFLEVLSVTPAQQVEHSVDLKSRFDERRVETPLRGPAFFSRAVGCMDRPAKKVRANLNWFRIDQPDEQPVRKVEVLDIVRGSNGKMLSIGGAEFLLSPSQLITTGAPDAVPDGLDHYKAYRIVDAPEVEMSVQLTGSARPSQRRLGKPVYLCLPVQEWHHHEHFDASHPNDCFVVYELDSQSHSGEFNTIDQFGLNELTSQESRWLCVHAAFLR